MFDTANFADSDIIFVGQIHGSPERHLLQAQIIEIVDPTAIGFEMLNRPRLSPKLIHLIQN